MKQHSEANLEFTGNWFIDAGILGFVNLMEEVYGDTWNNANGVFLNILLNKFPSLSKNQINNLFTCAFWYKTIKDTVLRWVRKDNFKKKIIKNLAKIDSENLTKDIEKNISKKIAEWHCNKISTVVTKSTQEVYSLIIEFNRFLKEIMRESYLPYEKGLRKIYASNSNKKTIVENLDNVGFIAYDSFFTNLSFFNPSTNKYGKEGEVLKRFDAFLNNYFVRNDSFAPDLFDKSLSPFVYSVSHFNNQLYGKPQTLKNIERIFGINPVGYILSFPLAFVWIRGKYYMFYSPYLEFTYAVNKKLKFLIEGSQKNNEKKSIFEITWSAIIDKVNEYKAISSLENMYIVEYSGITNQQIQNVEYIGISKPQASLIIDDYIRDHLNKSIPTLKKDANKRTTWIWLLEEFVKSRSLMPHIINYIHGKISDDWKENEKNVGKYTLITSLAIDAEIKKMKSKVYEESVFDTTYFFTYKNVVSNVKTTISTMYSSQKTVQNIVKKYNKTKVTSPLLGYIKGRNKYGFVNLLLKYMIGRDCQYNEGKSLLVNYLFNNVLSNDLCWENYALPIVIGITYGGEKNGG